MYVAEIECYMVEHKNHSFQWKWMDETYYTPSHLLSTSGAPPQVPHTCILEIMDA